ncbi:hypothetical protein ACFL1Q_00080 [Patescibacteria group bacterium]
MHIDINSCFATCEQQANPLLRGKPVAVAAYLGPSGCVLAASTEAKRLGIKTGMRVRAAKGVCPKLTVLLPDPDKYRNIHLKLKNLLCNYSDEVYPKSIDEFVLEPKVKGSMFEIAKEIKQRIKADIGEYISVSIGISTNRFLAKTASNLQKPDGLRQIDKHNFAKVYADLSLTDFCGIKFQNATRLQGVGIYTPWDFYQAPVWKLRAAFGSIVGYYWHLRLHGYEIDDVASTRGSFGNSYVLPKAAYDKREFLPILAKLTQKMGMRLREAGYKAQGVHLSLGFKDQTYWHKGTKTARVLFDSRDFFKEALRILQVCPFKKPVASLAISVFNLVSSQALQLDLFEDVDKKKSLTEAVDSLNKRWGIFCVTSAKMLGTNDLVPDRIAFGSVKELEEFVQAPLS